MKRSLLKKYSAGALAVVNALTIDVEDWYHVCGLDTMSLKGWDTFESRVVENTRRILKLLAENDVRATFFVLGYIAKKHPELVKEIDACGHELATHGFWHSLVYKQDEESFREDLRQSIDILRQITGKNIVGHRAASFSITRESLWALDILSEEGIRYDCSVFPISHPRYGIIDAPRFQYEIRPGLIEFPPSTVRIFGRNLPVSGGIYFKILPYVCIKNAVKKLNRDGRPVQIYFHPWELDPAHPRLDMPFNRKLTLYTNVRSVESKIRRLLGDFRFGTAREAIGLA